MSTQHPGVVEWLAQVFIGGGLMLLLTWAVAFCCRQPARRQRLGEWGMLAALLLPILGLGPRWIVLPLWPVSSGIQVEVAVPRYEKANSFTNPATAWNLEQIDTEVGCQEPDDSSTLLSPPLIVVHQVSPRDTPGKLGHADSSSVAGFVTDADQTQSAQQGPQTAASTISLDPIVTGMTAVYVAFALLLLGRWLLGHWALHRILKRARPAPRWAARLFVSMRRGRQRLLVSDRLWAPISCGLVRPVVVVPADLCRPRHAEMLRWVFAHELTHLQRRDAWTCLLFGLGQVVYFAMPWFWWLKHQVRLCQEYIADSAAAEHANHVADYAQFLLNLTRRPSVPVGATGVGGNSSDLFRRVTMLLKSPMRVEKRCPYWWSLGTAVSLLALAVLTSGIGLQAAIPAATQGPQADMVMSGVGSEQIAHLPSTRVVALVSEDEGQEDQKKAEQKKETPLKFQFDLENWLKDLPEGADREQIRKHVEKALEQARKAIEESRAAAEKALKEGGRWKEFGKDFQFPQEQMQKFFKERFGKEFEKDFPFQPEQLERLRELYGREFMRQPPGQFSMMLGGEGRLGVIVEQPSDVLADQLDLPQGQGLVVKAVRPDSAAAKAGIKPNDILLELNGKAIKNDAAALVKMLSDIKPKTPFELLVLRKGKKETLRGELLPERKASASARKALDSKPEVAREGKTEPKDKSEESDEAAAAKSGRGTIITLTRKDGNFTAQRQEGSLTISVTGKVEDEGAQVSEIKIQDGSSIKTFKRTREVPEQYRDKVRSLIDLATRNQARIRD